MIYKNSSSHSYDRWSEQESKTPLFGVEPRNALAHALDYSIQHEAYRGEKVVGDYLVAYSVEPAKWLRYTQDGAVWQEPRNENAHIVIAVHDLADLHMIPNCTVTVSILDEHGNLIGTQNHPFLRRPRLYHYGQNWNLPGDGIYRLHIKIDPPELMQYSEARGFHLLEPVEVDFDHVEIKTGHNIS